MKLIVGLGNPGKEYENTRHNLGFMFIDYITNKLSLSYKNKLNGMYTDTIINKEKYIFLKPLSYMNLSGEVVKKYVEYFNIETEDILVIYDDVDFRVGTFKIKRGGSSAGHNGIKDIINKLNTENIKRIRIGTSKSEVELYNYVLGKLGREEKENIEKLYPVIYNVVKDFSILDIESLMSKYNNN